MLWKKWKKRRRQKELDRALLKDVREKLFPAMERTSGLHWSKKDRKRARKLEAACCAMMREIMRDEEEQKLGL